MSDRRYTPPPDVTVTVPGRDRRAVAQALLDAAVDAEARSQTNRSRTLRDFNHRAAATLRRLFDEIEP